MDFLVMPDEFCKCGFPLDYTEHQDSDEDGASVYINVLGCGNVFCDNKNPHRIFHGDLI